jgi:beta-lactamase regulating signal transducer with metallopeptidase domain
MMTYADSAIRFIVATLFSGLWQAPLFALAAWLVLRVRPNANATTRHSVLAAALLTSLVLPVVTAVVTTGAVSTLALAPALMQTSSVAHGGGETQIPKNISPYNPAKHGASVPSRTTPVENIPSPSLAVPSLARTSLSLPHWSALALVAIWFAGAAFVLLRLMLSLGHLERLKRDALPLPVEYRAALTRWATASKGSRAVRLCTSEEIEIPIAVGLFDAMILVPTRLLEELEPHDIDSIVLHELAHLRRADDWVNAIERFAQAFLFFNPGILWLNAQLDLEREVACDDWVLQKNDALPYATCLAKVVETTVWPFRAMTAPGAFVTRRGMSIRIERLLAKHRDVRVHTSFGPAGAVVGMLAVLGLVAAFVSPSIAYSVSQAEHPSLAASSEMPAGASDTSSRFDPEQVAKSKTYAALVAREARERTAQRLAEAAEHQLSEQSAHEAATIKVLTAQRRMPAGKPKSDAPASEYGITTNVAAQIRSAIKTVVAVAPEIPAIPNIAAEKASPDVPKLLADANAPDYVDELASVGYTKLSVDDLVQMKAVGVSASFIRDLERQGCTHPSVSDLVQMRAVGVDPTFIGAMRRRYGDALSIGDIVGMRTVGVTSDYIDQLSGLGIKNLTADRVRSFRALGVTPAYVRSLSRAGYPNLTVDQIQQFKALGVDRDFISNAASHGFHDLTIQQLIDLKATGVL